MTEIILHRKTKEMLEAQIKLPSQGILLTGEQGIGKAAVARWLSARLLERDFSKILESPFVMHILPKGKSIPVESIRQINSFLKLKSVSTQEIKRIIIIEDAGLMTLEAQNALLKNLEEPPEGTVFILTALSERELLPTVVSRLQTLKILSPTKAQLKIFFALPDSQFEQKYNLSGGLPGLFTALAEESDHPLLSAIEKARGFLVVTPFDRLKLANDLSGQKAESIAIIQALKRMADAAILNASNQQDDAKIHRWQNILEAALIAEENLEKEANLKLVLTNLALNL